MVGVEPQASAVNDAKLLHKGVKNLGFYNSLIEDFKTNQKFDLIISSTVFEHLPNQKNLLKKGFIIVTKK